MIPEDIVAMKTVPYINAVSSLIYLTIATKPDIAYCEGDQSRALQEIPQVELCYRMGYNSPPGDSSEN